MLKRIIVYCLVLISIFSFVGCGNNYEPKNDKEISNQIETIIENVSSIVESEPSGEIPCEEDENVNSNFESVVESFVEGATNGVETLENSSISIVVSSIVEGVETLIESQVSSEVLDIPNNDAHKEYFYFNAYILEADEYSLIIEPFKDSMEFEYGTKICVLPSSLYENSDFNSFKEGDIIEVVYRGLIVESKPPKIYADEIYVVGTINNENVDIDDVLDNGGHLGDIFDNRDDIVIKKPVIYLYPEVPMNVNVEVSFDGNFIYTYPIAPKGVWDVYAYPNGNLINNEDGREHSYIFWEGTSNIDWDMSKGFVVKGEDTLSFLEEKLEILGLSEKEANEFINYWVPLMQDNEYNLITFQNELYIDNFNLDIYPTPDSTLRVFMVYKALDNYIEIEEPILNTFNRTGFCVVEWGGTEIK